MMAAYTQLLGSDIQEIGDKFNLMLIDYESIATGAANSNYFLRTQQGNYVLTVLEDKTFEHAVELGSLLLLLRDQAIPTSHPLFATDGKIVIVHKGKPVMVKVYVEGEVFRDLSDDMLFQVGVAMARLHQVPAPSFLSNRRPYGVQKFSSIQGQKVDLKYESWIANRFSYFEQAKPTGLPKGLIHGDLFYDNVIFEDAKLKAIIDFEEAMNEDKVFDLGMGIVGLCSKDAAVSLEKVRALVKGYEKVRELEDNEKESLKLFIEYAAATVSCWRYWKYHIDVPSEENAAKHWQMAQIAEGVRSVSESRFFDVVFG